MHYKFHPDALEEYREAARWYAIRERAVGARFLSAIEDAIQRVVEAPTRWRVVDEDVHRCLAHVFPYAILYTIEADYILIVAVMHCSREPGYWQERVRKP
jgi:plasmid stabilization system protein ParE